MKRKIKDLISVEAIRHIKYIPIIIKEIKNWNEFLLNYITIKNTKTIYKFRNNLKIFTINNTDAATIAVIFFKKDYGIPKPNSTIIDIGANIGTFTLLCATKSKNNKIYSYEPMPETFKQLNKNINLNKLKSKVKLFNKGISSKKEKRNLYLSDSSAFNSIYSQPKKQKSIRIDCISLKDVFESNKIKCCDILKIDCEGAEYEIFYSTPKKYLNKIKEIRMEYHKIKGFENHNIKSLIKFFRESGFKLTFLRKDTSHSGIAWFKR